MTKSTEPVSGRPYKILIEHKIVNVALCCFISGNTYRFDMTTTPKLSLVTDVLNESIRNFWRLAGFHIVSKQSSAFRQSILELGVHVNNKIKKSDRSNFYVNDVKTQIRKFDQSVLEINLSVLSHWDVFNRITLRVALCYKYHLNGK